MERGSSGNSNRGSSLGAFFNSLLIRSSDKTRKAKPLPSLPLPIPPPPAPLATSSTASLQINQHQDPSGSKSLYIPLQPTVKPPISSAANPSSPSTTTTTKRKTFDIKRVCIPDDRSILDYTMFAENISNWKRIEEADPKGRKEEWYYNQQLGQKIRGCCSESKNIVTCCALCDHDFWIFQGSEYDPFISLLYGKNDGCIPFEVKLKNPKFIIPWRYKNRRTGTVSWKIIHLCGSNVEDAECETIVVNIYRDKRLRKLIERVCDEANRYEEGAERVDYLLAVVRGALGDYGMEGGTTSSQADASLYAQMKKQGHNFMFLCQVKLGLCRHKALLFKILADAVGIECALITGYSTGGRHQWNVIKIQEESYIIDPTSPHFTWAKSGSARLKAYKINPEQSFGHGGLTLVKNLSSSPDL